MEAILAESLMAAAQGVDANPNEKVFHILDHVFLGTKFGAADRNLLDALEVRAVINLTAGVGRVPNFFDGSDIEYLHIELLDELVSHPGHAIPLAYRAIKRFGEEKKRVLVHCSAGLSRSATAVLSWLMRDRGMSLRAGKELIERQRGRRPKCNPSFWCYLSALERELCKWPAGTEPSIDWVPLLVEDLRTMGINHPVARVGEAVRREADWIDFVSFYTHLSGSGFRQIMVAQGISQRPAPEPKAACRAAAFALEIMEVYHALAPFQAYSLRILQPLLCHRDARVRNSILSSSIVGKALEAMRAHLAVADVQEAGCATVAYAANISADAAAEVLRLGGAARITEAMREHPEKEQVQVTGCIGLTVLLQTPTAVPQLLASGAVAVLQDAVRLHTTSEKVHRFAATALQLLDEDDFKRGRSSAPPSGTSANERLTGA